MNSLLRFVAAACLAATCRAGADGLRPECGDPHSPNKQVSLTPSR